MEKIIMKINTIIELEELLATEEYKFEMPKKNYIKAFEQCNTWTNPEAFKIWDIMISEKGYPPTLAEYTERMFKATKDFWYADGKDGRMSTALYSNGGMQYTYLEWNEGIEVAVRNRLARMYRSFIAEYSAQILIAEQFPESIIMASNEIDLVVGVDLAVMNKTYDTSFLVHVTKSNRWTEKNIKRKSIKKTWLKDKNGKRHWYQRSWNASHTIFAYTEYDSEHTKVVNGHMVFRDEYIYERVMEAMANGNQTYKSNEMMTFHNWLKRNNLKEYGIKDMIIFKHGKIM